MTATYPIEAGLLIRRELRQWLDRQCFVQQGKLDISYHEVKGLLESNFLVRVSGPDTLVRAWCAATGDVLREAFGD